jgi:hypothetical protein
MNARITIDIPIRLVPALESALAARRLVVRPYIKGGHQRLMLSVRQPHDTNPLSLPDVAFVGPREDA